MFTRTEKSLSIFVHLLLKKPLSLHHKVRLTKTVFTCLVSLVAPVHRVVAAPWTPRARHVSQRAQCHCHSPAPRCAS